MTRLLTQAAMIVCALEAGMRLRTQLLLTVLLCLCSTTASRGVVIYDNFDLGGTFSPQFNTGGAGAYAFPSPGAWTIRSAARFTVNGANFLLSSVTLPVSRGDQPLDRLRVRIALDFDGAPGATLEVLSENENIWPPMTNPFTTTTVVKSTVRPLLLDGQSYWIVLEPTGTFPDVDYRWFFNTSGTTALFRLQQTEGMLPNDPWTGFIDQYNVAFRVDGDLAPGPCEWWQPMGSGTNGLVRAVTVHNGALIAGGEFTSAGGQNANSIASWNGFSWQTLGGGMNSYVHCLAAYNGNLIAGGAFTQAGGQNAARIARWNGSTWQSLATSITDDQILPSVNVMALYNDDLIAAGRFDSIGGALARNVARWNGSFWAPVGGIIGSTLTALAVYNGELFAGSAAGATIGVRRWNGTIWSTMAGGPNGNVASLYVYNGELIAGSTTGATLIMRWNGSTWSGFSPSINMKVNAMSGYNGALIIAGSDVTSGIGQVARWNGSAWQIFGTGNSFFANTLTVYNNELVLGSNFSTLSGQPANSIARWSDCLGACCFGNSCTNSMTSFMCQGMGGGYAGNSVCATAPIDITGNGTINIDDLVQVIVHWGPCAGCPSDVTGDGLVNIDDLVAVITGWGPCS